MHHTYVLLCMSNAALHILDAGEQHCGVQLFGVYVMFTEFNQKVQLIYTDFWRSSG
jgi:hypothetical protein